MAVSHVRDAKRISILNEGKEKVEMYIKSTEKIFNVKRLKSEMLYEDVKIKRENNRKRKEERDKKYQSIQNEIQKEIRSLSEEIEQKSKREKKEINA